MKEKADPFYEQLAPLISSMGYVLLEANSFYTSGACRVYLTVYSDGGLTVDDCSSISRVLHPRLEITLDSRRLVLEVSSPGLERRLTRFEEFTVFRGRHVKVLINDGTWISGLIVNANGEFLKLDVSNEQYELHKNQIMKAQLNLSGG